MHNLNLIDIPTPENWANTSAALAYRLAYEKTFPKDGLGHNDHGFGEAMALLTDNKIPGVFGGWAGDQVSNVVAELLRIRSEFKIRSLFPALIHSILKEHAWNTIYLNPASATGVMQSLSNPTDNAVWMFENLFESEIRYDSDIAQYYNFDIVTTASEAIPVVRGFRNQYKFGRFNSEVIEEPTGGQYHHFMCLFGDMVAYVWKQRLLAMG